MVVRRVRRLLWTALLLGVLLLTLKTFVGDVYRISSSSMAPLARVDEYVFVLHDRSAPERFDLVVARHEGEYLVKRAVGVGGKLGEEVRLDDGDLRIQGKKLPASAPRPPLVVLFDDAVLPIEDHFRLGDVWTREPDGRLVLDGRDIPFGANAGLMGYVRSIRDGWLEADGTVVEGLSVVADAAVEVEFVVREAGGRLRVALLEERDTFEFVVDLSEEGLASAQIVREGQSPDVGTMTETVVPFELGVPIRMRFMNRDDHLSVDWLVGAGSFDEWRETPPAAQASYDSNAVVRGSEGAQFERVQFGGEGCVLELRRLRISRDLHWTNEGTFGVTGPIPLQPGEVYMLGDNSRASHDSRHFGAISGERIIGRPLWVVWPWSAIRRVR